MNIPILADIRGSIQQILDRESRDRFDENELHQAVRAAIREELGARSAQGQGTVRDVIEAKVSTSDAAAPASGSETPDQLIVRLGRVRFDKLEEDDEILGEGAFGVVYSGTYMGKEVAVKKARGLVGDPAVQREFRWVFFSKLLRCKGMAQQREASVVNPRLGSRRPQSGSVPNLKRCNPRDATNIFGCNLFPTVVCSPKRDNKLSLLSSILPSRVDRYIQCGVFGLPTEPFSVGCAHTVCFSLYVQSERLGTPPPPSVQWQRW